MATISENKQAISDNNATILANVDKVYEAGKKAEYDRFWDGFQQDGTRQNYNAAFSEHSWTLETFRPKYDIRPTQAYMMFRYNMMNIDLVERLNALGVALDFSECANLQYALHGAYFTRIGTVDCRKAINTIYALSVPYLTTIDKVIFSETTKISGDMFSGAGSLANITVDGVIAGSINFNWSPLSVASMKSIISCLKDLTGTDGEGVYTIKFSDTCWANLEADSTAPDGGAWKDYVQDLGWVI